MEHYFIGKLNDLKYIWTKLKGIEPISVTVNDENIDLNKINYWYTVKIVEWELTYEENDVVLKKLLSEKKLECQTKILENYSRSDQANITGDSIVSWDDTEFVKMRTFINAMLDEFHTNWKDADFSDINP